MARETGPLFCIFNDCIFNILTLLSLMCAYSAMSLGVVEFVMMEPWLLYILICLATHRATRFFTRDHFPIVAVPRERITNWWDPSPQWRAEHEDARPHWGFLGKALAFLWECDWCLSMWVGAGIIYGTMQYTSVPLPVLAWLTASTVSGLIAMKEPD